MITDFRESTVAVKHPDIDVTILMAESLTVSLKNPSKCARTLQKSVINPSPPCLVISIIEARIEMRPSPLISPFFPETMLRLPQNSEPFHPCPDFSTQYPRG